MKNHVYPLHPTWPAFDFTIVPNPVQQHALDLLNVRLSPGCTQ
ncbi:MAG TPA: hypothetical protein PK360_03245 [bacterium]|nr:hypothetical protein [bacterium]